MSHHEVKPFFLLKPYFAQHTETLLQTMDEVGVKVEDIYKVDDWPDLSRKVYESTVAQYGERWRIGMEGYLQLVSSFFGNRGMVLLTSCTDVEEGVRNNLRVKKRVREKMLAGPTSNDIVIMMNLSRVLPHEAVTSECGIDGVLGIQGQQTFSPIAQAGLWDNYYFKYLHTSDCVGDLTKEYEDLVRCDVLSKANQISPREFRAMAQLKTFLTPRDFGRIYRKVKI